MATTTSGGSPATTSLPPDFDAWTQTFTLLYPDGTEFQASMGDLNYLRLYGFRIAINWATQIGASLVLLLVLILLTKREKRKSSIFIMNALCLILNTIRSLLQCIWLTGEWFDPYTVVSADYSRITASDRANTIASNTILTLLVICIFVSLSLQVWVVCVTAKPVHRLLIMGATTLVALVALGYRFAVQTISNIQTMKDEGMEPYHKLITDMNITQAVAIWFYCCVFTFKLGYALIQRRKLKMNQFGPMQVIFIMGCQTMIIPAIFTSLQFYDTIPELGSQGITVICIFLPLSAIWAGLVASDANVGFRGADAHQRLLRDQFYRSSQAASTEGEKSGSMSTACYSHNGKEPESPTSPIGTHRTKDSVDDTAIYVGRDWTIEAGERSDMA